MTRIYLKPLLAKAALCTVLFSGSGHAQDIYTVESIPYHVYPASLPFQQTLDDKYSEVFNIPFNFDYFGNTYNQMVVSTNGYIDFRTQLAGDDSPWEFAATIPNGAFPVKNSILGCYHDMWTPTDGQGTMTYAIAGTAPYRQFVLMYNNQTHYGGSACAGRESSFQIILYETLNYIDVQVTEKGLCTAWNDGNAVIGVINSSGNLAYTPPGRNTGAWEVTLGNGEGWRFRPDMAPVYRYMKCDPENNGFEAFDLTVVQADLSSSAAFYGTMSDAQMQVNALPAGSYTNIVANKQTIYAAFSGQIMPVELSTIDCTLPFDNDNVATMNEDLNADGNLANDDTDGDGLPDFADNDDDGDLVLTSEEYIFGRDADDTLWDTDGDTIPNYLDNDDDGDGVLTMNEDYDHNGNAGDDDIDNSGLADYLEMSVTMGTVNPALQNAITLYPNPASDILNINNATGRDINDIAVYSVNGVLVKQANTGNALNIADLQSGMYFVKIQVESQVVNYKFMKK